MAKVNQTAVNFINESAKAQSISIREKGFNIGIDADHQIKVTPLAEDPQNYDLVWVGGYRDAGYEIYPETIERVANALKGDPQRRSF